MAPSPGYRLCTRCRRTKAEWAFTVSAYWTICDDCEAVPRKETEHEVTCVQCGERFEALKATARTCSTRCRVAAHRAAASA